MIELAPAVHRFAARALVDKTEVEDVTQEALASLWAALKLGKKVENPSAFVHQAAFRISRRKNRRNKTVQLDELPEGPAAADYDGSDLHIDLCRALPNLDEKTRTVVACAADFLDPTEIACALGFSKSTVLRRLGRLKARLFGSGS